MRLRTSHVLVALCLFLVGTGSAYAADLTVDCSNPKAKIKTITAALGLISKAGPNTIHVSGACDESVFIDGFDNLTLLANPGASINDPTPLVPDDNNVIDIFNSRRVTVQGFTINQGFTGISCGIYSVCFLNNNTVQGAFDVAVQVGRGTLADLNNDTLQNSGSGLRVQFGGQAHIFGGTIEGNDGNGVAAINQGLLDLRGGVSVQNNGAAGIVTTENSTTILVGANITGNAGTGVTADQGSVVRVGGANQITGNGVSGSGAGVAVGESSFAFVAGSADLSGNPDGPVICVGTFSNAVGQFTCQNP